MNEDYLLKGLGELTKKHPGKYVAVVDSEIVSVSDSEVEAFKVAKRKYPAKLVSLRYIPRKDELVTLL